MKFRLPWGRAKRRKHLHCWWCGERLLVNETQFKHEPVLCSVECQTRGSRLYALAAGYAIDEAPDRGGVGEVG